jgi:hypothetical protein
MNYRDRPEISKSWWTSEKPPDIKGRKLEKALQSAEKALLAVDKEGDAETIDACLAALESVVEAADKTIEDECDEARHEILIAVLKRFDRIVEQEVERLEAEREDLGDDDEESKGKLFESAYLEKMLRLLKGGNELKFCFGIDKSSPEDSCLLLDRKRDPERLFQILRTKSDFSKRLTTYGLAKADGKTIEFRLAENANEPSQIVKLAREFLRKNDLKFKKIRVVCPGGQSLEEAASR